MRLYKRGRVYWTWVYENGKRVPKTTGCHDQKAAEVRAAAPRALADLRRRPFRD